MVRASLRRNRLVSAFMAGFLLLSNALLAAAAILATAVFGSVTGFMTTAQTPHFMQMHVGAIDADRLQSFADGRPEVAAIELIQILNVDNAALTLGGHSLDAEIQQNGFATQGRRMDYLLAADGTRIQPEPGQIYLPFFYEDKYALHAGDRVDLALPGGTSSFTVAGFFRDSQMNSTLASSKRLLI
ncbi:MAG: hypothetical protein Q4G46_14070, partial [Propionibacteriaceae bacterium]|nr:hypothetical protein [Propionibacteriaceae bacterium]